MANVPADKYRRVHRGELIVEDDSGAVTGLGPIGEKLSGALPSPPSGGSGPLKCQTFGDFDSVPDDTLTFQSWAEPWGDDLLDVSDPLAPSVKVAGLYIVTVMAQKSAAAAGKFGELQLEMDVTNEDVSMGQSIPLDGNGSLAPRITVCGTWPLPIGGVIRASIHQTVGAAANWRFISAVTCIPAPVDPG
jgi:hypothetical protein